MACLTSMWQLGLLTQAELNWFSLDTGHRVIREDYRAVLHDRQRLAVTIMMDELNAHAPPLKRQNLYSSRLIR